MTGPDWHYGALCSQTDPELFFPEMGGSVRDAKRLCGSCPVKDECLEEALANREQFGVWGETTPNERREILRGIHGPDFKWPVVSLPNPAAFGWGGSDKCSNGHQLTEDNILNLPNGDRRCRQCKRDADREWSVKRREARAS